MADLALLAGGAHASPAPSPTPRPALLTVAELAAELRVSRRTVELWVARGQIRSIRLGRCRRVPRCEIERVLAEGIS